MAKDCASTLYEGIHKRIVRSLIEYTQLHNYMQCFSPVDIVCVGPVDIVCFVQSVQRYMPEEGPTRLKHCV